MNKVAGVYQMKNNDNSKCILLQTLNFHFDLIISFSISFLYQASLIVPIKESTHCIPDT
jgi:hypothetical protein